MDVQVIVVKFPIIIRIRFGSLFILHGIKIYICIYYIKILKTYFKSTTHVKNKIIFFLKIIF